MATLREGLEVVKKALTEAYFREKMDELTQMGVKMAGMLVMTPSF